MSSQDTEKRLERIEKEIAQLFGVLKRIESKIDKRR
jgi:hypothetical protein